jgi:hypothetical protein
LLPRRIGDTTLSTMRVLTASLCAVLAAGACSSSRGGEPSTPPTPRTSGAEGVDAAAQSLSNEPDASQPASPSPPGEITVGEVTRRPAPAAPPRVVIRAPASNAALRENRLEVRLEVERWRNVSDPADLRHVCVALDAEPCRRVDDPARPVVLEGLREGPHVVRAWAAWESHEAVPSSLVQASFFVGPAVRDGGVDPVAPGLVVATPEGELTGGLAQTVLVDLLLTPVSAQTPAAQGIRTRVEVDGREVTARDGAGPFSLSGLGAGAHTLTFTLLGADGAPRTGPLQRAERRVLLRPGEGR